MFSSWWLRSIVLVLVVSSLATACGSSDRPASALVLGADRTGSVADADWPAEVAMISTQSVQDAFADDVDEVHLIGIGTNLNDTSRAASIPLTVECGGDEDFCTDERERISGEVGAALAHLVSIPPSGTGTDVVAAIITAKDLCGDDRCRILLMTDGADLRLTNTEPVEDIVERTLGDLPQFGPDDEVELHGVGANASSTDAALRVEAFFEQLLTRAGVTHLRIGRSL